MPNEPERDIEKLLKACAQKRRDEAGARLELHPATRRMLHAEVARRTAKAPHGENFFARMLSEVGPRLAFGAAILAVLLVATWALLPSLDKTSGNVQMAQRDATSPAKLAQRAGPEAAAAPAEAKANKPEAEALPLAFDSARKDAPSAAVTVQDRMAEPAFEIGRRVKMAEDQVRDKGITTSTPEAASTARDGTIGMVVVGGPLPAARADDPAAFRTGRYGLAGSPAPQRSEPASVASAGAAGLARQAAPEGARERSLFESDSLRKTEVALAPQAVAAPRADLKQQVQYSAASQTLPVSVTQRFAQVDLQPRTKRLAKAAKSIATEEILTSFQIAQAGDQIEVIDTDGSTYAGFLRPTTTPAAQPTPAVSQKSRGVLAGVAQSTNEEGKRLAGAADIPAASQNLSYFFQVEGTNRTFRQRVVFAGNLLVDSNALSATQSNAASDQRGAVQFQQSSLTPSQLQNSRVTGQAVVGEGRTIEINAVPAAP